MTVGGVSRCGRVVPRKLIYHSGSSHSSLVFDFLCTERIGSQMGIRGLEKLVRLKDNRSESQFEAVSTVGKSLLIDLSALLVVCKSRYWASTFEESWRKDKSTHTADSLFLSPINIQERIKNFIAAIRKTGLVPVFYLDGSCADHRRDQKLPTQVKRASDYAEVVSTLIASSGTWGAEARQIPASPLILRAAIEALYKENVHIIQCSEEADARLIRDAEKSPETVFGICANDSDFFLAGERVQYIPIYELERAGDLTLKYRYYNRNVVQKILNIRKDGLFDVAVFGGCDYTTGLEQDIQKALHNVQPSTSASLKEELKHGLERLCEKLNSFPKVGTQAFLSHASPNLKNVIMTIFKQANGELDDVKHTEQQILLANAVQDKKIPAGVLGFLYNRTAIDAVHIQAAKYPTYPQIFPSLESALWLFSGCQQKVAHYCPIFDGESVVIRKSIRDPVAACPALVAKLNELGATPGLPVSLQCAEKCFEEKGRLFDLIRCAINWNVFDGLEVLNEYPELKSPVAAVRYLFNTKPFNVITPIKAILLTLAVSSYVKKVPNFPRNTIALPNVTFVYRFQQLWDDFVYLAELVFGKRNEKKIEIVEDVWSCDVDIVANTELAMYLFTQQSVAIPEICKNLDISDMEEEITKRLKLVQACVQTWKASPYGK